MLNPHFVVSFAYNGDVTAKTLIDIVYEYVDEIVMIESTETFSGFPKQTLYHKLNARDFVPFRDKLTILQIDTPPPMPEQWEPYKGMPEHEKPAWFREFHQRDLIQDYLSEKPFILYCCDADEIPNPVILADIRNQSIPYACLDTPIFLDMKVLYYNCNWYTPKENWRLAFVCNDRCLARAKPSHIRIIGGSRKDMSFIPDAGWHCTFFSSVEDMIRKIESYSHLQLNQPSVKTEAHIRKCLKDGVDLFAVLKTNSFRGDTTLTAFGSLESLPKPLRSLHRKVIRLQSVEKN